MREDVTDIVLNIKAIAIKMQADGVKRNDAAQAGPRPGEGGRHPDPGDIQILNPELVICTLDEGAEIRMEFSVKMGKGYVPGRPQPPRGRADRFIPVDSLYSPVRKVSYRVENTREGRSSTMTS